MENKEKTEVKVVILSGEGGNFVGGIVVFLSGKGGNFVGGIVVFLSGDGGIALTLIPRLC